MTSQNKILLPLADGFEEIEAITIIDVLRRAELEVTVTGLSASTVAQGAHGVAVGVDANMDDVNLDDYRAIVLPGGLPGATNLRDDSRVIDALKTMAATGRITAAICAAPPTGPGPATNPANPANPAARSSASELRRGGS